MNNWLKVEITISNLVPYSALIKFHCPKASFFVNFFWCIIPRIFNVETILVHNKLDISTPYINVHKTTIWFYVCDVMSLPYVSVIHRNCFHIWSYSILYYLVFADVGCRNLYPPIRYKEIFGNKSQTVRVYLTLPFAKNQIEWRKFLLGFIYVTIILSLYYCNWWRILQFWLIHTL